MILTDRFVFIHLPSTGGTFVTRAIDEVYRRAVARGDAPSPVDVNKHGTCDEIPESHRHLPIVSNVRNTYDHYVAYYEYGWWRRYEMAGISKAEITELFPHFPDLSFAEFVDLTSAHFNEIKTPHLAPDDQPGYHSEQFVRFFFRQPERVLQSFGREYVASGRYADDMYDVRFLRNDRLTDQLCELFEEYRFGGDDIDAVRALGRVHPARVRVTPLDWLRRRTPRRTSREWRPYYDAELAALVRRREWFLFELFADFDVAVA